MCEFAKRFQEILLSEEAIVTYRTAIRQLETHPDLAKVYVSAGPQTTIAMLAEYLTVKQAQDEIAFSISAKDAAMQLLLMFHGRIAFLAQLGQPCDMSSQENEAYIESCVDLFLNGYSVKK
ncbi:TetR/AcrR family transcriptional regulator C-terminal domain-containing protein [Photobacterium leiognathi subsp. mandapamensis]|uniref:TetR/AcrR family transcriptional regulator C-terminal domain-containing protein n=1 Tax=Photobacterium leiognathi TaxID=553611 RepID=UPI003BF5A2E9